MVEHKFTGELKNRFDLVVRRIEDKSEKKDALILFEGDEGEGKTNASVCFADYIAQKTGRTFDNSCIFFKVEGLIDEAKKTKKRIFVWDEPALQGLRKQWWNKVQTHLTQLLMMARKNQHLFIFNVVDFSKFNEYIIRRAIFMIRIFRRKETSKERTYFYYPRKKLRAMFDKFTKSRVRMYKKFKTIFGRFQDDYLLPLIIDEQKYEEEKDKAIMSIAEEEKLDKTNIKLLTLQYKISQLPSKIKITFKQLSELMDINDSSLQRWKDIVINHPEIKMTSEKIVYQTQTHPKENNFKNLIIENSENPIPAT